MKTKFFNSFINLESKKKIKQKDNQQKIYNSNREDCNFLLGCFMIDHENYDEVKKCLEELCAYFESLNEIAFKERRYKIEYFLGGDLKFLALALGLQMAGSNHPCPWCVSDKFAFLKDIHNHSPDRVLSSKSFIFDAKLKYLI